MKQIKISSYQVIKTSLFCSSQARNQEFFRAGEFSRNLSLLINIQLQHEKEMPRRKKNLRFFCMETLKNCILNEKFYPQMTTIRAFFPQIRALFSNFRKRAGETFPPSPSSQAPVIRILSELHKYSNETFQKTKLCKEKKVTSNEQKTTYKEQ